MKNKNNHSFSEKGNNSSSKPRLVKLIASIGIIAGVSGMFAMLMFMMPRLGEGWMSIGELRLKDAIQIIISVAWLLGGIGLMYMKKWGALLFSALALFLIIKNLLEIWPIWDMWRFFGTGAMILVAILIIGAVASLAYLWKIRKSFE